MSTPQLGAATAPRIAAVARYFGLGAVQAVESAPGTNDNYLIATDRGEFVVKFLVNADTDEIARGLPFLDRLTAAGFSAVVPYLRGPDGTIFYQDPEGAAVMLARLPGGAPVIGPAVSRAIGAALARLHLVSAEGLPPKPHWIDDRYLPEALNALRERAGDTATARLCHAFDALDGFDPARLPHSLVHGDLDTTNCLFDGQRLVAFLDWQDVGVGASVLDFAMTILGFCFHEAEQPDWHGTFDPNAYAALYASYTAVRPFTDGERAQLDAALRYVGLTQPVWSLLHWDLYHPGEPLDETRTLYWRYGLDTLNLPAL